jgi:hypothetical protein
MRMLELLSDNVSTLSNNPSRAVIVVVS